MKKATLQNRVPGRGGTRCVGITVSLTIDLIDRLHAEAERRGMNKSRLTQQLLEKGLA